jgi:poly(3-hydroxybutyrate) depolymerase
MGMGGRGTAALPSRRPDKSARLAAIVELEKQIASLRATIQKAKATDPCVPQLQGEDLATFTTQYNEERDAINQIATTLNNIRPLTNTTLSIPTLSEIATLAKSEKATKVTALVDVLQTRLIAEERLANPTGIVYPPLSDFLYGNTGVNAPPEKAMVQGTGFPFRILLPLNFNPQTKYPVIVYLHGGGETGTDNERHLTAGRNSANGGLALVSIEKPNNRADHPCFFVAPQMPVNNWYNEGSVKAIKDLLNILKTQYPQSIDTDRICLTGLSSGGMGSWNLPPQITPNPFSCIVPQSAFSIYPDTTPRIPIWNFHAINDSTESIYRGNRRPGELGSDVIVPRLREQGYTIIYTRYDTGGHNIWINAYQHPQLLHWMFAQRLGQPQQGTPGVSITGSSIENGMLTLTGNVTADANFTRVGWSTSAFQPSELKSDGVGNGTTTFVSESSSFNASYVGQRLGIPNRNADLGIQYYNIVEVINATTVKLSANVQAGTYTFRTYPYGTMENPRPAEGSISPTWKLTGIPVPGNIKQVQVVCETSTLSSMGGLTTINLAFKVNQ